MARQLKHSLANWNIQEIQGVYKIYGNMLKEYEGIANRLGIELPVKIEPGQILAINSQRAEIVSRMYLDVKRLNTQLAALDREIARRNVLVGVM